MRQILQNARTGETEVVDLPTPKLLPGCVLVKIAASLLSAGTERAATEFASKNLFQKAFARPDLVKDVFNKVQRDGIFAAFASVQSRLDRPSPLGYSSAGTVIAVAENVSGIHAGDRVACAGSGYAVHAEMACVPQLLVAKLPASELLTLEEAAFTTLGAVALHGIRTAGVKLGESVAVIGLGLVGQLTSQLLKAAGCTVIGLDTDSTRSRLALDLGADVACFSVENFQTACLQLSAGRGVDAVLITAETPTSDPVNLAAQVARDRGVIVAVGTVGMDLERKPYYEKELEFRVSRSYGPGRYDTAFEQKGRDYPVGYVRWTETRNMEAFLHLVNERKVDVKSLITHRFPIEHAEVAYSLITGKRAEPFLGVLIQYPDLPDEQHRLELVPGNVLRRATESFLKLGVLGAGNFAAARLLPAMKRVPGISFSGICASSGTSALHLARKFGFQYCATDEDEILKDANVNVVAISTRHHLHASQVISAMRAGKHVFCEKPLCLNEEELREIVRAYRGTEHQLLMVGFNRRFAPMTLRMKAFLDQISSPMIFHYRANAGSLPDDHWINDPEQGGGRILGEVCHFLDLLTFLAGSPAIEVHTREVSSPESGSSDNAVITLQFANGSSGTISYLASGDRSYSKERLEVFGGGSIAVLEDFRRLELVRNGRKRIIRSRLKQDKGHIAEWKAFAHAIQNGEDSPIAFEEIVASTLATIRILASRSFGGPALVDTSAFLNSCTSKTSQNLGDGNRISPC